MILWTIQSQEAYDFLQKNLYLTSNNDILKHDDLPLLKKGYDWMCDRLRNRTIYPSISVDHQLYILIPEIKYPLWAWYKIDGKQKKPDLRRSGYAERGTKLVLMKVDIPDEKVLLSDFNLFHYVLNFMYAGSTLAEDNKFEYLTKVLLQIKDEDITDFSKHNTDLDYVRQKIIESWDVIFDITSEDDGYFFGKDRTIQAVFWGLYPSQVIEAIPFIAK